jgi:hypothetical protein
VRHEITCDAVIGVVKQDLHVQKNARTKGTTPWTVTSRKSSLDQISGQAKMRG